MAWETAEPPASERSDLPTSDRSERPSEGATEEQFGPIALARHVKDDGRALILYRRLGEERP